MDGSLKLAAAMLARAISPPPSHPSLRRTGQEGHGGGGPTSCTFHPRRIFVLHGSQPSSALRVVFPCVSKSYLRACAEESLLIRGRPQGASPTQPALKQSDFSLRQVYPSFLFFNFPSSVLDFVLLHIFYFSTFLQIVWGRQYSFKAPPYPGEDSLQHVIFGDLSK